MRVILYTLIISSSFLYSEDINDPFEELNRISFEFNEKVDANFLKPVAETYSKSPRFIKKGVTNFFDNLEEIDTTVNQLLQGKPVNALNDLTRFVINSTVGLGGIFDVASPLGLPRHEEDFSQTLALWGVPSGPYIMLPLLGPSSIRDVFSRPVSSFLSVTFHMTESDVNIALKAVDALETRERLLEIESLIYGDRYDFVKDSYVQYMIYEVSDGENIVDEFVDDMDDFLIE